MLLLKTVLLVWCFTGTLAGPLDIGLPATDTSLTADDYWNKLLERSNAISKASLDKDETWQSILDSLAQPTAPPNVANFNKDDSTNIVVPKYYDNNSYGYSYSSSYSDYSGIIFIIIIIKIILLIACCGCRVAARRPAQNGVALRIPNAAQPRSLTIIRRHIFLVVPENNSQNVPTPDDSHDPASHLEQKSLLNEDLPPAYEEVSVSNGNPPPNN